MKNVVSSMIALAVALASSPAFADLFVGGTIVGGVSTNPWQTGFVSGSGSGSAVVAGPFGVSVGSVQLGGNGIVAGGGSAQFRTQGQVVQNGLQVQVSAGAVSAVQAGWGGTGQSVSFGTVTFQRF